MENLSYFLIGLKPKAKFSWLIVGNCTMHLEENKVFEILQYDVFCLCKAPENAKYLKFKKLLITIAINAVILRHSFIFNRLCYTCHFCIITRATVCCTKK